MRWTPQGWGARVDKKLLIAGWSPRVDANSWAAIRVISFIAGILLAFYVQSALTGGARLAATIGAILLGLLGPEAILSRRVDERKAAMERDLPDVIDLLVISVEAGLGFEQALQRVIVSIEGPLPDEFSRMLGEVRAGSTRAEAMRAMDARIEVPEVRSFVLAILQADTFGVSIGRVLRTQAEEMRIKRRQLAEERAQKAPVKMLIPMVFCIFPALFTIVLGPAVIRISENF